MGNTTQGYRVDWVDFAKGICIILVVMMHSTLGMEKALGQTGALNAFIERARPFRMPDFFMTSGLFLARRINVPWREYLNKKVIHFVYFYILWMTIQFAFKGYGISMGRAGFRISLRNMCWASSTPSARCGSSICSPSPSW